MSLLLHEYWRSGTSYRVRIALNLKGLAYESAGHDLRIGEQQDPAYLAVNPQGLMPALVTPQGTLTQSPAILEWIEETWPEPPLLPASTFERAEVRAMAAIIGCDIHPLQNLRVLKALGGDQAARNAWAGRWIAAGFDALERRVEARGGRHAFGDSLTLADVYLVPQLYSARRFEVDLAPYPRLVAAGAAAEAHPAVAEAAPERQPGADNPT